MPQVKDFVDILTKVVMKDQAILITLSYTVPNKMELSSLMYLDWTIQRLLYRSNNKMINTSLFKMVNLLAMRWIKKKKKYTFDTC